VRNEILMGLKLNIKWFLKYKGVLHAKILKFLAF